MHPPSLPVSFTLFDYIIIALLAFGCLFGFARGFLREIFALIVWLLAYGLACVFSDPFSSYVSTYIDDAKIAYLLTFVLIFFVVWLVGSFICLLISIFTKSTSVPFVSRLLGGFLGVGQGILIAFLLMFVMSNIPNFNVSWFEKSISVNKTKPVLSWMKTTFMPQQ